MEVTQDQPVVPPEAEIQGEDQHMVIQVDKLALVNKVDQAVPVLPILRAHTELPLVVEQHQDKVLQEAVVVLALAEVVAQDHMARTIENICKNDGHFLIFYSCTIYCLLSFHRSFFLF